MGVIGKDFKYKISNFITNDELKLLKNYCGIKHRTNRDNFDLRQSNNHDTYFYGDPTMDALLLAKQNLMEKETGKELYASYSFWRMYTKYAVLENHFDRPSCEISVTAHIDSDKKINWPIIIDGKEIYTEPGDAVIYLGAELYHERKEFKGDYHLQTFLHYVDKNGKYADHFMDKREFWGLNKLTG